MRWSLPALVLTVATVSTSAWAQSDDRASMLSWINATRAAEGLSPLTGDARLDAVADAHARDMAANRFFSHTSPSTGAPADRASAAGIGFRSLAENIAMNQSARAAHEALLRSPGHRANLLSPTLRRVGLGFARGPDGLYVAQLFATMPEDEGAPTADPLRVPVVPQVPAIPQAPAATGAVPSPTDALPQVLNALPGLLDVNRWTRLLPNAPRPARAPARPSARAEGRGWSIPTPFGVVRVPLPTNLQAPRVAPEETLAWDDDDAPSCESDR